MESKGDNQVEDSSLVSIAATSPVPGVSATYFMTEGTRTYTTSSAYGYFKETNEYPVGSGNMLTSLIKWVWISNDPGTITSNSSKIGTIDLNIETENQYIYVASRDSIEPFDNRSFLRIQGSPYIEVGLAESNAEIFSKIVRSAQARSGSTSVDWKSLVGLLPYGDKFTSAYDIFTAVKYKTETSTSGTLNYHQTVWENIAAYGDTIRDHRFTLDSNEYLASEGDRFNFDFTVTEPKDKAIKVGTHYLYYKYNFDVYSRNGWGSYSVLEASVDKNISGYYSVN